MLILTKKEICFKDYTLVIPSVSVGNVGQLAADLLITTLHLSRIGFIRHPNIAPLVGPAEDGACIATECEMFASTTLKIAVVQIRSSFGPFATISNFMAEFCKLFKCIVIVSGSFAYEQKTVHLVNDSIRYLKTTALSNCVPNFNIPNNWKQLELFQSIDSELVHLPGSGIGDHLFNLCEAKEIPAAVIVMFLSEGDNRGDAIRMADYLDNSLQLRRDLKESERAWRTPASWDSLCGNAIPDGLF